MALFVMLIIIVLNIVLLLTVMRIGTQGDHHSEFAADQSTAVMTLYAKLGLPTPSSKQGADTNTIAESADDSSNDSDSE